MRSLLKKIKAFSLAEMLIVLTIAMIILAASAPIITKKAKAPPGTPGGGVPVPVGAIMIYGGQGDVPFGWIECDGRSIKEKRYAKLRTALGGVSYVPDMSGTHLMGMSDEPHENDAEMQAQLKDLMKQYPEMGAMLDAMKQSNKKGDKRYPKPILVRWIIKADP